MNDCPGPTSATGGFLIGTESATTISDKKLALGCQATIAGITGLPGDMVRRMGQPNPPQQTDLGVDWCAYLVGDETPDDVPVEIHSGSGDGSTRQIRQVVRQIKTVFYGPNSDRYASRLRDGFYIGQNREALAQATGGRLQRFGSIVIVPEQINQTYVYRADLSFDLRFQIERIYQILNVSSADGTLIAEEGDKDYVIPLLVER